MHHHDRMRRGNAVEQCAGRMAPLRERILVIAFPHNPLPVRYFVGRDKMRQRLSDLVQAGGLLQRDLQQRLRGAGKMAVRVQERRQQRTPIQVDLCRAARPCRELFPRPHGRDHAVFDQQRFSQPAALHCADRASIV